MILRKQLMVTVTWFSITLLRVGGSYETPATIQNIFNMSSTIVQNVLQYSSEISTFIQAGRNQIFINIIIVKVFCSGLSLKYVCLLNNHFSDNVPTDLFVCT